MLYFSAFLVVLGIIFIVMGIRQGYKPNIQLGGIFLGLGSVVAFIGYLLLRVINSV